jgi:hypothetical protein
MQNAKCNSKCLLGADDNRGEDPCDLLPFPAQRFHLLGLPEAKSETDPQPVHRLACLTQRDLYVSREVALGGSGLGFLKIGSHGRPGLQQLVNETPDTWSLLKIQGYASDATAELKGAIANLLGSISHAPARCTGHATSETGGF